MMADRVHVGREGTCKVELEEIAHQPTGQTGFQKRHDRVQDRIFGTWSASRYLALARVGLDRRRWDRWRPLGWVMASQVHWIPNVQQPWQRPIASIHTTQYLIRIRREARCR